MKKEYEFPSARWADMNNAAEAFGGIGEWVSDDYEEYKPVRSFPPKELVRMWLAMSHKSTT